MFLAICYISLGKITTVSKKALIVGVKERHLESIIQATLRHIILVQNFPRTLIQMTLQICQTPEPDKISTSSGLGGSVRCYCVK